MPTSAYLQKKMAMPNSICYMQVVFVDIVKYSKRISYRQVDVIYAFMNSIQKALNNTGKKYYEDTNKVDFNMIRDVVKLPSGDGAAIGFPLDGVPDMHISFACELLRLVDEANKEIDCSCFREHDWCDCHSGFRLRCGISEGRLILYNDLNDNFNIAGNTVNMAARVMDLAGPRQIFLTQEAHTQIKDSTPPKDDPQFRKYSQVSIKHGLPIDVYHFIDKNCAGFLDISTRSDLDRAVGALSPANQVTTVEPAPDTRADRGSKPLNADAPRDLVKELRDRMVRIPKGEFSMGNEQTGRVLVEIPLPFLIDRYPITQEDYMEVMGRNPSRFVGPHLPVDSISWLDAITFCIRLSELSGLEPAYHVIGKEMTVDFGKNGYRLPTEAEWEYCCRGGTQEDRYGLIDDIAWYNRNSEGKTHEVGEMAANGFGLYDMLGNVREWCNDWYENPYPEGRQVGYIGPGTGFERVLRGGSWSDLPDCVRASFRLRNNPLSRDNIDGFRVVLPVRD
ncbi:MAG: SUMF1/EgtB/PvdO family nonheme iron enzyme [Acidobacteriota bacterium]